MRETDLEQKRALVRQIKIVMDEIGFDGKSWLDLTNTLNHRGVLTLTGKPWGRTGHVRNFWMKYEHLLHDADEAREADNGQSLVSDSHESPDAYKEPGLTESMTLDEHASHDTHNNTETPLPDDREADESREAQTLSWDALDARMRAIATEVAEKMILDYEHHMKHMTQTPLVKLEFPPEPVYLKGARGRRMNRKYTRFTIGIDQVLAGLLTTELEHQRVSLNRFMDAVLWTLFNKPILSYMSAPEPEGEPTDLHENEAPCLDDDDNELSLDDDIEEQ